MASRTIHRYHRRQEPDALACPSGSVRGPPGNRRSYRDSFDKGFWSPRGTATFGRLLKNAVLPK